MKRLIGAISCILVGMILLAPSAHAEETNIYAPYDSFEDMRDAYIQAIEDGDVEKQKELYKLGESTLEKEIELSKKALASEATTRYNPDEQYWISQFPKLFASGYWRQRDEGVTLSLTPNTIVSHGTQSDAARGWNSVYAKFRKDSNWTRWNYTDSMEKQYYCHYRNAKIKPQWNLEPWRPANTVDPNLCN